MGRLYAQLCVVGERSPDWLSLLVWLGSGLGLERTIGEVVFASRAFLDHPLDRRDNPRIMGCSVCGRPTPATSTMRRRLRSRRCLALATWPAVPVPLDYRPRHSLLDEPDQLPVLIWPAVPPQAEPVEIPIERWCVDCDAPLPAPAGPGDHICGVRSAATHHRCAPGRGRFARRPPKMSSQPGCALRCARRRWPGRSASRRRGSDRLNWHTSTPLPT